MTQELRPVGKSGVFVPAIGFGSTSLADMPGTYGYSVEEERAYATIRAIFDLPHGFLDTSRNYGLGRSEERIGHVVRERGGWPASCVLSTKLDRDMDTLRFDAGQARRSVEESLEALGVERIDILHLHDPEHAADLSEVTGKGGALDELMKMKEEGLARAVGLAAGKVDVMMPILRDWDFDAIITHNRWTLVNHNAGPMMDLCAERGIAVFNAAPYAGGALAKGAAQHRRYVYQEASDAVLAPIRAVEEVCARHGVPPGAAALQFSMREGRIASTILGVSKPERVAQTLEWAAVPIPQGLWDELAALPATADDPEASRQYSPD
ncbi:MAG: aldo/keto reductase [Rubellimicrobium sp.]|nr:aldo/keto reductase [Rubellimicrobium sp.]